jgi:hypothetical protein
VVHRRREFVSVFAIGRRPNLVNNKRAKMRKLENDSKHGSARRDPYHDRQGVAIIMKEKRINSER